MSAAMPYGNQNALVWVAGIGFVTVCALTLLNAYYARKTMTALSAAQPAPVVATSRPDEVAALRRELESTRAALRDAQARAVAAASAPAPSAAAESSKKKVRIYMDGVFDLMHYGHSNALRQARAVGDELVVGLCSDEEVVKNKGSPPVMTEEERYIALSACKFVDEVVRAAPYELTEEWVNKLITEYRIDYIVHGDDPCITADGKDAYAYAKSRGVYRQIKRTEGVSTTDIVGRMLLMTREHHVPSMPAGGASAGDLAARSRTGSSSLRSSDLASPSPASATASAAAAAAGGSSDSSVLARLHGAHNAFLPTARRIMQFADGRVPKPEDRVVYLCGGFDLFNAGHIAALQAARALGDFLLVGIHDDATVHALRGHGLPILNLYERTLSLLSCRYVDEVIIGAPWVITEEMIKSMNITIVARGTTCDMENEHGYDHMGWQYEPQEAHAAVEEAYALPAAMGILRTFRSPGSMTAMDIIDRILAARATFQKRYEKKSKMEEEYVTKHKTYIAEA